MSSSERTTAAAVARAVAKRLDHIADQVETLKDRREAIQSVHRARAAGTHGRCIDAPVPERELGSRTLEAGEARAVLDRLLAAHPDLRTEAEQAARSLLGQVSFESVADDVEHGQRG